MGVLGKFNHLFNFLNRHFKYSAEIRKILEACLWYLVKLNPTLHNWQYAKKLEWYSFYVNEKFISRIFQQWHWSRKKPTRQQIQKYSSVNIQKYWQHITGVLLVPYEKLKYLDEAHFVSKDFHAQYALGEEGNRVVIYTSTRLDTSYSLTLMTTLSDPLQTCVVDLRHQSNTQWDFFNFLKYAIEKGYLTSGDVLVVFSFYFLFFICFSLIMLQYMLEMKLTRKLNILLNLQV